MSWPIRIDIVLETHEGCVTLRALNNELEVARVESTNVREAVPALVSFFKDMQDATIEALYASGIIRRDLDALDALDEDTEATS